MNDVSHTALLVLTGALGLAVGSFLNVCIYRIPRGESLVHPASRCPRCGRPLQWFHNIPVVSWLVLRGRCGHCGAPISVQYPVVELTTALLAMLVVAFSPPGSVLAARLVLTALLIVLFVIDLEHQLLPNVLTLPGIAAGFVFSLFGPPGIASSLMGILLGGGILYGIAAAYYAVRGEEGMGMGDVKMLAMIGAFLGWQAVLLTLVLASFAGASIGVAIMATRRESLRYALPFGTFLALGAFAAMLFGGRIVSWYAGLLV